MVSVPLGCTPEKMRFFFSGVFIVSGTESLFCARFVSFVICRGPFRIVYYPSFYHIKSHICKTFGKIRHFNVTGTPVSLIMIIITIFLTAIISIFHMTFGNFYGGDMWPFLYTWTHTQCLFYNVGKKCPHFILTIANLESIFCFIKSVTHDHQFIDNRATFSSFSSILRPSPLAF